MFYKILVFCILFFLSFELQADSTPSSDGKVTKVYAHYETATSSTLVAKDITYKWGQDKNLVIDGFEYNGQRYSYADDGAVVKIRRSDNSNASGSPCGIFAEKNGNAYNLKPTYPQSCDMAKVMAGRIINVGALDLFKNTGYTAKNVERVDFIYPNGIIAPSNSIDLLKAGHVVTEKSGNNELKIAAILEIGANGNPTKFGKLVDIHGTGSKDYGIVTIYLPDGSTINRQSLGFYRNEKNSPQGNPWHIADTYEPLGMCFVTLADLGISAGQKYYGFAYFGRDVTDSMNLVNYSSFPKTTDGDTADPYGGVASYFVNEELLKDFGDAPDQYTHVSHKLSPKLYMGDSAPDAENDQQSSSEADGDGNDDNDGLISIPILKVGDSTYTVKAKVYNNTGKTAYITAWIDFNRDGIFQYEESLNTNNLQIPSSNSFQTVNITWDTNFSGDYMRNITAGKTIMRIRLTTSRILRCDDPHYKDGEASSNYFVSPDGEVEDYQITISNNIKILADYHFDECSWNGSDGEVKDSSGNGYDGKAYNSATTFDDNKIINRSGKFIKSQNQYVKITNFTKFNQDSFTASLWIKVHDNVNDWQTILHKGSSNNSVNGVFRIKYNYNGGDDKLGIYSTASDGSYQNFYKYHVGLKDKKWHHLVVTFQNNEFKVYLDKTLVVSKTYSKGLMAPNSELHIGGKYYKSNMYIDEVKIFDGALSLNDIETIYDNEKAGKNYDGSSRDAVSCGDDESMCYAISDVKNKLYKVVMKPGANPLPLATTVDITGTSDAIDGEGGAYNSNDGKIYAFHESSSGPKQYAIDPNTGQAQYIKTYHNMKSNIVGASFYGGYFYVIAKNSDGDATLYKISTSNWDIISTKNINGDTTDADALAINQDGEAYIITDNNKKLYSFDINNAKTVYKFTISTNTDAEALSFAKDGNLYVENSENSVSSDTDKIYKIDLSTGELTASAQLPHNDDIDIEGLSCNVVVPSTPPETGTCEEAFSGAVSTTRYRVSMSGNSLVYNNNNPIKTKIVIQSGNSGCEGYGKSCNKTNTNASIYDFVLDYGTGKDGEKVTGDGTLILDGPGEYTQVTASGNGKLYINGNVLIRANNQFSLSGNSQLYINGEVTIHTDSFSASGDTIIHIESGYLKIVANKIDYSGTTYTNSTSLSLILLSKNDISFSGNANIKAIIYADGKSSLSGNSQLYGAVTSDEIDLSGDAKIFYDKSVVDSFCNLGSSSSLPNITISDINKYEGDSGTTEYIVTVTLDEPAQSDLTLTYSTEDGTAKATDSDYQSITGSRTISKGTSSFTIKVYVNGDKKVEDDEYFYLNIKLTN